MRTLLILIVFVLLPLPLICQEDKFFFVDNSNRDIIKKLNVSSLKIYNTDYEEGLVTEEYLMTLRQFDKNGNLIHEIEYLDSKKEDGWEIRCEYNTKHLLIKMEMTWIGEKSEITEYIYDFNNRLISSCFIKEMANKKCKQYYYDSNGNISLIYNDNGVEKNYSSIGDELFEYSSNHKLKARYKNNLNIYSIHNSIHYFYEYNSKDQLIKTISLDSKNDLNSTTLFEYSSELLLKVTFFNEKNKIDSIEKYYYEYFE